MKHMTTEKQPFLNGNTRVGYIVKWALTEGLVEGHFTESNSSSGVWTLANNRYYYYHANEIRWTREDAIAELNKQIEAKRKSIAKQLTKLDELSVSPKFTTEGEVWPKK